MEMSHYIKRVLMTEMHLNLYILMYALLLQQWYMEMA